MSVSLPRDFVRVNHARKCPICGRHDWCLIRRDGSAALCPRTPSERSWGEWGFLHQVKDGPRFAVASVEREPPPRKLENIEGLICKYEKGLDVGKAKRLAIRLGVHFASLVGLRMGWSYYHAAFTFPMYDALRRPIGLRLRNDLGQKWSVAGSRNGLFIPYYTPEQVAETNEWYVVEGPTDTAALLSVGLAAIGRPNDRGGGEFIAQWIAAQGRAMHAVVVLDAGDSGIEGGCALAAMLHARRLCASVRTLLPPYGHKDARRWVRAGADAAQVRAAAAAQPAYRGAA